MPVVDLKEHLIQATERHHSRLVNDLKALPAEKAVVSPGGCARTAVNIAAECGAINGFVARFLKTGEATRPTPEERQAFLATFDTVEKALNFLETETQALLSVIGALDAETLGAEETALFGRPMSRFAIAELPAMHMSYHDGQLTYIQSLHGDDKNHW